MRACSREGPRFTPAIFAEMLGRFGRLRREEFDLDDAGYKQLAREVERWRERSLQLGRRLERGSDLGLDV